jgi:predicted amidophosphoribosyltransferase
MAAPLSRRLGVRFRPELLIPRRPRAAQLVLSGTERWKSVRGAYATRQGVRVDKLRILLVDDVMTIGATLDRCARVLRKAGAAEVFGLTVARLVPGWASKTPL